MKALEAENIESRPLWKPMHHQPVFKEATYVQHEGHDFSGALFERGLCLPSGLELKNEMQERVSALVLTNLYL